jgi:ribonuclease HII
MISELHESYEDFWSGYPSDPKTINFLKQWKKTYNDYPPIVRKSWKTLQRL